MVGNRVVESDFRFGAWWSGGDRWWWPEEATKKPNHYKFRGDLAKLLTFRKVRSDHWWCSPVDSWLCRATVKKVRKMAKSKIVLLVWWKDLEKILRARNVTQCQVVRKRRKVRMSKRYKFLDDLAKLLTFRKVRSDHWWSSPVVFWLCRATVKKVRKTTKSK